ncbi:MAG: 8-amino-7-oxononanoate synthase [Spirochaetota bacterium]
MSTFSDYIASLKANNSFRQFTPVMFDDDTHITVDGRKCINFASNNYLSLAHHPKLIEAAMSALTCNGTGGTSSRFVGGNTLIYDMLEERIARFKRFEKALVFPSGYTANLGAISALCGAKDCVYIDKLDHASIIDGITLARTKFHSFPHRNYARLREILARTRSGCERAIIAVESVFSMDGDISDLAELRRIADVYDCLLLVDEAHATGVFGARGAGVIEESGVSADIEIGTLSKGIPSAGGYIAASEEIIDVVRNRARSLMYTTALPPSSVAVAHEAIAVIESMTEERAAFRARCRAFAERLTSAGYGLFGTQSQIIPVRTGDNDRTLAVAGALRNEGIFAVGIRHPTVPKGEGRIRISINRGHTDEDIEALYNALTRCRSL